MTKHLTTCLTLLVMSLAWFLTGCGHSDSTTVAEVGDEEITVGEFLEFVDENAPGFGSADEEFAVKRGLLDSLVEHRLLVQAAYELGIDQTAEMNETMAANQNRFQLDALYERHIGAKSAVTDAEVRDAWKDLEYQVRAFHILVKDEDTAKALFERVKAGENFEQLAYEYSTDESAKRNRGDLGYFTRGSGPENFEKALFNMEVGEVSPPVETTYGWHIIKLVDRKLNDMREEFPRMRLGVERQLEMIRRMELTNVYFDGVRSRYPITVDTAVADYITHKRTVLYPPPVVEKLPKNDFDDGQLDRDEKELILGTWDGGQITLIDYLVSIRRIMPDAQRPDFDNYDSLASAIYQIKKTDILVQEAKREDILNDPLYLKKMRMFKEFSMAEIMRNDTIKVVGEPTEEDMRAHYDQNRGAYMVPARIHLYEIMVSDEMLARRLAQEITTLEEFRSRASQLSERAAMRVKGGDLGYIEQKYYPNLYEAAERTSMDAVGGPIVSRQGKYSLIWPVQKTKEVYQDFLAVKNDIARSLMREMREKAVADWTEERSAEVGVDIYEDVVWETIDREIYVPARAATTP